MPPFALVVLALVAGLFGSGAALSLHLTAIRGAGLHASGSASSLIASSTALGQEGTSSPSPSQSIPTYTPPAPILCNSVDQPNPVAATYPNNATGTLNGTVSVIPIPLSLARQIIPAKYGILEHAYRSLLPGFPEGMYPAIVQALHDHDVQAMGYNIQDFTRTGVEFPFLDILGDNYSSFKWAPSLLMTAGHEIALQGAQAYGTNVFEASFDPECDAYRTVPNARKADTTYFGADSLTPGEASLSTLFSSTEREVFPLSFFQNFTNQPTFADGKTCDNMIRLFNTTVSQAPYGIEAVEGSVRVNLPPFTSEQRFENVYGLRFDSSFIENNYLPCENFRGYSGTNLPGA